MSNSNGSHGKPKMQFKNLGSSGLKVAKVIVGAMSYGSSEWQEWVLNEEETRSLPLLKHAYDHGLNTWDTADVFSHGESERIIATAIKKYEIPRSRLVILSKCHFGVANDGTQPRISAMSENDLEMVNQVGLSRKHIFDAVQASVDRLRTYIDVLQIHRLDRSVPPKEIMKPLNDVIEKGWVRYIGAFSMAAWEFQNLQWIARTNGWAEFISMQNYRVGLIPWSPVARGVLTRHWSERTTKREQSDNFLESLIRKRENETDKTIVDRVEHGVSMACIATAWSIYKGCCPIIGLGSKERIEETVANVNFQLSEEDAKYLEEPYLPKPVTGY